MSEETGKRIKALKKKLSQIDALKQKSEDQLDQAALEKIRSEPDVRKELAELEVKHTDTEEASVSTLGAQLSQLRLEPEPSGQPAAQLARPELTDDQRSKQSKGIKKKLRDIEALKAKGLKNLDADAKAKVANEEGLKAELAQLEAGQSAPMEVDVTEQVDEKVHAAVEPGNDDPFKRERAQALEPLADDVAALIDAQKLKEFKALQKKLREIGKLHEKDKGSLQKLQVQKLEAEQSSIQEISEFRAAAVALADAKRKQESMQTAAAAVALADAKRKQESTQTSAGYPAAGISAGSLDDVHFLHAITQGLIAERRSKYVDPDKWRSTFRGVFRVSPPDNLPVDSNFRQMKTFEYFLWTDVNHQPIFNTLKKSIANTIVVNPAHFCFMTRSGTQMPYDKLMLTEFESEVAKDKEVGSLECIGPVEKNWKIVDIQVVVKGSA